AAWGATPGTPWVPTAGPTDTLAPANPTRLLICAYSASAAGAPTAEYSVHDGFTEMADELAKAPSGTMTPCPEGALATYLIRADYGDASTTWVTVTSTGSGCGGSSNGAFTTNLDLATPVAAAITNQGSWGAPYPGDCGSPTGQRPGVDQTLVPTAPD